MLPPISARRSAAGLLLERGNPSELVEPQDPHLRRIDRRHRLRRDRDVGSGFDVRLDQLAEVHAVEMIASQDQEVVGIVATKMTRRLADGIGRPLKPVGALGRLLRGQHFDEALGKQIEPIRLSDVAVERSRVELRQHEDPFQVRVEAVADGDVDEPVLAPDRHRGLRAHARQRKQPRAAAAAENQREDVVHDYILSVGRIIAGVIEADSTDAAQESDRGASEHEPRRIHVPLH